MLLQRSIIFEFLLTLIVTQLCAQEYDGGEHEEVSSYDEGGEYHGHPDYSKYYSVDTSAPISADTSGFVGELSGFTPIVYGESSKAAVTLPAVRFTPQQQQTQAFASFAQSDEQSSPYATAGLRDFFEESQQKAQQSKQEKISEDYVSPGPHYISHQVPFLKLQLENDEEKAASRDDVERIPPRPNKPKKDEEAEDAENDFKIPEYDYSSDVTNTKAPVDYNIGKSSSTVSQYPTAAGFLKSGKAKISPYEKYSFQPVTEAASSLIPKLDQAILSTLAPFNPTYNKRHDPIEIQSAESRGCRKLVRHASDGIEQMNCFVCENADSKSKYTQCSYSAEKEPSGYYTSNSASYSLPSEEPHSFRYKRYTSKHDPYYTIRERSRKAFEEPTIPEEYNLGFYYDPDTYDGSSSELSFSEKQTEELKKNPANCQQVESEGMTCTVCKDPKTGGNYEQCSYSTEPKEKKYAYVTEKKYDTEDQPEESRVTVSKSSPEAAKNQTAEELASASETQNVTKDAQSEQTQETATNEKRAENSAESTESSEQQAVPSDTKPVKKEIEALESHETQVPQVSAPRKRRQNSENEDDSKEEYNEEESEESSAEDRKPAQKQKLDDYYHYEIPSHFAETIKSTSRLGRPDHQESSKEDEEVEETEEKEDSSDEPTEFDEYHFKLFPELKKNNQASAEDEEEEEEYHIPAATKHNVEEVLAEFTKKDRSACKKSERNGMTCFLCVDQNKIQHEECMYVQESRPVSSHVAYHGVKGLKQPEKSAESNESANDETKNQPVVVPATEKPSPAAPSNLAFITSTIVPYEANKLSARQKRSVPEDEAKDSNKEQKVEKDNSKSATKTESNEEPTLKTPTEFQVGDEDGAFSAETKPVYSKTHGVELPRYMVEQSEFEKEFDLSASTF